MQDSFVSLFREDDFLAATTSWLGEHGYQVVTFDAGSWVEEADLHRDSPGSWVSRTPTVATWTRSMTACGTSPPVIMASIRTRRVSSW